jgi:hypothetical protein
MPARREVSTQKRGCDHLAGGRVGKLILEAAGRAATKTGFRIFLLLVLHGCGFGSGVKTFYGGGES